ncbi:MAG TPA: hypothetical protein VLL25_09285, partial [Acidimicrobiales bacterium]|nr:hypothetical protein [Acidimicrobiales bacterium]
PHPFPVTMRRLVVFTVFAGLLAGCGSSQQAARPVASSAPRLTSTSIPTIPTTTTTAPGNSDQATTVVADCGTGAYRPARIVATCGNSGVVVTEIQWSTWTTTEAVGDSVVQVDPCKPSCAAQSAQSFEAQVTLANPVMTSQGSRFSKLTLTWKGTKPFGNAADSYPLPTS